MKHEGIKKILPVVSLVLVVCTVSFSNGCASKQQGGMFDGKYGYIDIYGKEIIPVQYDLALPFSEGLAAVKKEGKYGFIDVEGNVQIPFEYDYALGFQEGTAVTGKDKKIGYITKENKTAIAFEYEGGTNFRDGIAGVVKNGKLGYIDKEGNMIIDFIYDNVISIGCVSGGLIPVEVNKKWGYIDTAGTVKIPFKYHRVEPFYNGRAYVSLDGVQYGFIDANGNVTIPLKYQYTINDPYHVESKIIFLRSSIFSVDYTNADIGVIVDRYGLHPLLSGGDRFVNGHALVKKKRKMGFY